MLLAVGGLALFPLQREIERRRGPATSADEIVYVDTGATLRRLSLGYEGLLADIYWTRAVQYFGRQRLAGATGFERLGPLLRIATTLDPHLIVAYRFGAIFLAEKPPAGAGRPEEALALLGRGIAANPDYWRLWQDVGFIYYWDLADYSSAARAFETGSERPGAMPWMKVMAATVAAKGGDAATSRLLWREIYRHAENDQLRLSAEEHLAALEAADEIAGLDRLLLLYRERRGQAAHGWSELVRAGVLPAEPNDPAGVPYAIGPDGRARLGLASRVNLGLLH